LPTSSPHVLLVPGFAGGKTFFLPFRDDLRARGHKADCWHRVPFVYRRRIAHYGSKLARDIVMHPADQLVLVGWSMGGLICVEAMGHPEAAAKVRRIIAYASPFNGTWAARLGGLLDPITGLNVTEMAPGHPKLAELATTLHGERTWDFLAINGTRDALASAPMKSLHPSWCQTGPYDHRSLLWNPVLFDLIHKLICLP
jgi:pimeloyl-ACP methyl ester carboxylesterase